MKQAERELKRLQRTPPWLLDLVPIAASLYTATSFWHLHFSRFGIRGVFTPLCAALAFAAAAVAGLLRFRRAR